MGSAVGAGVSGWPTGSAGIADWERGTQDSSFGFVISAIGRRNREEIRVLGRNRGRGHRSRLDFRDPPRHSIVPRYSIGISGWISGANQQRQSFLKALSKSSKEYESSLKSEYNKFQAAYQKFSNEKASHLQIFKGTDIFSKYELDKEKLISRYEQMRKKEKAALSELEKAFTNKIARSEEALKKKKQDDKSFSILRKSLGSFLEVASDDE